MSSTTYFYLYKITIEPHEDGDFSSFKEILENPIDSPIKLAKKGNQFQLDGQIKKINGFYTGTFCLIQKDELPTKAKFGEEPLNVFDDDDDSGLGHYTSFVYDASNEVIAIQSNKNGVSANGLIAYFRRNYRVKEIFLEIIINPDELEKLQKMTSISSFVVTIAKPESGTSFNNPNQPKAISEMTEIADKTDANTMTLQLSIGYEKNATLRKGTISSYVRSLFSKNQIHDVRKVEIRGKESDENNLETLDLVTKKVSIPIVYTTPKTITPKILREIIKEVIDKYTVLKPQIDRTYKVKRR
jgi:hypothetical protein